MRIITHTCETCGSIVAGNVLEKYGHVTCPGVDCEEIIRFDDLSEDDQKYLIENSEKYSMDSGE